MDVSIIIVNYNTSDHLRECLKSIYKYTREVDFEIIVVDNNSTDDDILNVSNEYGTVQYFFRKINDGFGAGCNYGVSKAKGKYFVFINPDIILTSNSLSEMYKYMESDKETGVCSPVLMNYDNNLTYIYNEFPNLKWEFNEASGIGNKRKVNALLNKLMIVNSKNIMEVDWVTGACLFLRSELFKNVKGYDNDYFLYYEDTDLQYRTNKLGFKTVILKNLKVFHYTNSSIRSEKGEDIYFFHINRSKLIYYYKNRNFLSTTIVKIFFLSGILMRLIYLNFNTKHSFNKDKKYQQYKKMLKLYLSGYHSLIKTKLN